MSDKKGWGSTVLGWFVVREGAGSDEAAASGDAPRSADELIARYASEPPPPSPSPVTLKSDVPLPATGAPVDFAAVYQAAGIDADAQGRIEKAQTLLRSLPAETPREVKRQIVEASLSAFGVPVERIIESGAQEIQALQAFIEIGQKDTQKILADANERIAALEKEVADVKALMERKVTAQYDLTRQCNDQKLKVQEVLEFFGQEVVARVVRESPHLVEPAATTPPTPTK